MTEQLTLDDFTDDDVQHAREFLQSPSVLPSERHLRVAAARNFGLGFDDVGESERLKVREVVEDDRFPMTDSANVSHAENKFHDKQAGLRENGEAALALLAARVSQASHDYEYTVVREDA